MGDSRTSIYCHLLRCSLETYVFSLSQNCDKNCLLILILITTDMSVLFWRTVVNLAVDFKIQLNSTQVWCKGPPWMFFVLSWRGGCFFFSGVLSCFVFRILSCDSEGLCEMLKTKRPSRAQRGSALFGVFSIGAQSLCTFYSHAPEVQGIERWE